MDSGDSGMDSGDAGSLLNDTHVVFQCESCRSVVGDSTSWIAANEPLESFTLSAVTDVVVVGDVLHHSTHVHDAGSSFFLLTCKSCKVELGRRYITTPSHLDQLRDNFSLYVSMVMSYQLGSATVKAMSDSKSQEAPLLLKVAERCMKLQCLVVMINERVCRIEQCLQDDGEAH